MKNDGFEQKSGMIRQLAALPADQFSDHLSQVHPGIATTAPNIAPHIFSAATNAVQFLNSKLPHSGNELPFDEKSKASKGERSAWLELHDLVSDPTSVLNHVKNGTLTSHHMEAMRTVYPDLHQHMVDKINQELGGLKMKGKDVPYSKKIAISKFIGQPLDSTMTSQNMQAIINSAAPNPGPAVAAGQKGKASGTALTQINKTNSIYQTPDQHREFEKGGH